MFISDYLYKYSCRYVEKENNNFLIQNIDNIKNPNYNKLDDKYYSFYCVLQNIISRGAPTKPSEYLKKEYENSQEIGKAFLQNKPSSWNTTIKGSDENNDYPARVFFEELFPKHLGEYSFLQQLTLPEAYISDIIDKKAFKQQQVDFYIPILKIVIEIDGSQHLLKIQKSKDKTRDKEFLNNGIKTFRISASSIKNESADVISVIEEIKQLAKDSVEIEQYKKSIQAQTNNSYFYETVIRCQILILELLKTGRISFNENEWNFNIIDTDITDLTSLFKIAYEDLKIWFDLLFNLAKIQVTFPIMNFKNNADAIKVDFSLFKNYTDENQKDKEVLFIRNIYYKNDYYRLQNAETITYNIKPSNDEDLEILNKLLLNLFGFKEFNNGQKSIIINTLNKRTTIGLLPTGGGKSLCYQLPALLQPGVCVVVAPIISLMVDQVRSLKNYGFEHVNYISSSRESKEKADVLDKLAKNQCAIVLISPERFQNKNFRKALCEINKNSNFALATIDEVHCLSEWGHDFRPSYLTLIKTISNICPEATLLGLTATASQAVLKDLISEFGIKSEDVKTIGSMDREELTFKRVRADYKSSKLSKLESVIKDLENEFEIDFANDKTHDKALLIFTPTVEWSNGCETISEYLQETMQKNISCYHGRLDSKEKEKVQTKFLNNEFSVLACTKAFGMGIDKQNIRATIHYGLPQSVESFYQEAGRAGRDKEKATCYIILHYKELPKRDYDKLFDVETTESKRSQIYDELYIKEGWNGKTYIDGDDLSTVMSFWLAQHEDIDTEVENICNVLLRLYNSKLLPFRTIEIKTRKNFDQNEKKDEDESLRLYAQTKIEFALYKLSLLGFVSDWTIIYNTFNDGIIDVEFKNIDEKTVQERLVNHIRKYDHEFELKYDEEYQQEDKKIKWYIKQLLVWSRKTIEYQRLQSTKNILDWCLLKDDERFRKNIENYFKHSDVTILLDVISDNPYKYSLWFDLLFYEEDSQLKPIDKNKAVDILGSLTRYIESYQNNVGLNYLYSMLKLYLNELEESDLSRLKNAFAKINVSNEKEEILKNTMLFAKVFEDKRKDELSKYILEYCDIDAKDVFKVLEDRYSLLVALTNANQKLGKIGEKLNGLFK